MKCWVARGQCSGPWEGKQTTFRLTEGKETHNQMMTQWNPSNLWLVFVNDKCLLMIGRRTNTTILTEDNVA